MVKNRERKSSTTTYKFFYAELSQLHCGADALDNPPTPSPLTIDQRCKKRRQVYYEELRKGWERLRCLAWNVVDTANDRCVREPKIQWAWSTFLVCGNEVVQVGVVRCLSSQSPIRAAVWVCCLLGSECAVFVSVMDFLTSIKLFSTATKHNGLDRFSISRIESVTA